VTLLEHVPNLDAQNNDGKTALHCAAGKEKQTKTNISFLLFFFCKKKVN
jgi:ankyrin repeat protein